MSHTVTIQLEPGDTLPSLVATCSAPEGSMCLMTCNYGCEYWTDSHDEDYANGDGHKLGPLGYCSFVEEMESVMGENSYGGDKTISFTLPVEINYDEGYTWTVGEGCVAARYEQANE